MTPKDKTRLTEEHIELLALAAQGELEISATHPVAHELHELGLLKIGGLILKGGGLLFSRSAKITPAGRSALADIQKEGAPDVQG